MWMRLLFFIAVALSSIARGYVLPSSPLHQTRVWFKKPDTNKSGDNSENSPQGWTRFIPGVIRNRLLRRAPEPEMDSSSRYHLRLAKPEERDKRHTITRIMRYLPDLTWETAEGIVDTAIDNDLALVRAYNSLKQVRETHIMLLKADPPVVTEVYDTRKDEVLIL